MAEALADETDKKYMVKLEERACSLLTAATPVAFTRFRDEIARDANCISRRNTIQMEIGVHWILLNLFEDP